LGRGSDPSPRKFHTVSVFGFLGPCIQPDVKYTYRQAGLYVVVGLCKMATGDHVQRPQPWLSSTVSIKDTERVLLSAVDAARTRRWKLSNTHTGRSTNGLYSCRRIATASHNFTPVDSQPVSYTFSTLVISTLALSLSTQFSVPLPTDIECQCPLPLSMDLLSRTRP